MDDIIYKLSSDNPYFTHLDLRKIDGSEEELRAIADELENNSVINRVSWKEGYQHNASLKRRIEDKVKLNNQTFQRHPNDFLLGLFSCHAYTDSEVGTSVEFSSNSGVANYDAWNEELKSWKVFRVFNYPESGRYYSVAYLNKSKKQLVLAHRGTKFKLWDFAKHESPLKTDLEGILDGKLVKHQKEAYVTTEKVVEYAKQSGYNVSFTGHSLGAWLAELSLYFAVNDFDFQCKAVTFDSPGSASTMESFKPSVDNHGNKPEISNLNITTYLSAPNLVNCCNPHIGIVFRIFPEITWINDTEELRSKLKKIPIVKHFEPVLMGLLSTNGHRIEPMVATFNSVTGKPKTFEKVLDWPCFKYQPKPTNITIAQVIQNTFTDCMSLFKFLPGIGWLAYEAFSKPTLFTVLKAFSNLVSGDIDVNEFQKVCEYSEYIVDGVEETYALTSEEQFVLRYEGHYSTRELNLFKDYYNRKSIDWYLNKLCKLSISKIDRMEIDDDLKLELKNLKARYKIKFEPLSSRKYILVNSPDVHIDALREKIMHLCEKYSEIIEILNDRNAFPRQVKSHFRSRLISTNLPFRSHNFLERPNVMKEIEAVLAKQKFVAISGLGGTGKSTIAAEFGRYLKEKRSDQIIRIIDADSSRKIDTAYKEIARIYLGINVQNQAVDDVMQSVHDGIENSGFFMLFIFDNVEEYGDLEAYLRGLSNIKNVEVIITTRHNDLSENLRNIYLNPFTREEAKSFLQNTTGDRFCPEDINKLIDNFTSKGFFLPYNLSLAVEYLKQNPLHDLQRCAEDLAKCNGETATFLLWDLINTSELSWLILQYSAYLDPDFISVDIFKELLSKDDDELLVAIKKLESSGLMSFKRQNGRSGLKLHRILQDFIRRYVDTDKSLTSVLSKADIFERTLEVLHSLSKNDRLIMDNQILHIINNFLRWLGELDNITSNTFVFAENAKGAIDIISNLGPPIKCYVDAMNNIANEVAGRLGNQKGGGQPRGPPSDHPHLWFENLETFITRAICIKGLSSELKNLAEDEADWNNKTFQRYPNDFVLGLFSCHACTDAKKNASVEFSPNSGVADVEAWNDELKNWTVFKVFNDPESGYYSVAYSNEDRRQMVFAHRDTTLKFWDFVERKLQTKSLMKFWDSFNRKSSSLTDLVGVLDSKVRTLLEQAHRATNEVLKHAKEKRFTVAFTGRLLGAYLAEFSFDRGYDPSFKCKAVTFDKPKVLYSDISFIQSYCNDDGKSPFQYGKHRSYFTLSRRYAMLINVLIITRGAEYGRPKIAALTFLAPSNTLDQKAVLGTKTYLTNDTDQVRHENAGTSPQSP